MNQILSNRTHASRNRKLIERQPDHPDAPAKRSSGISCSARVGIAQFGTEGVAAYLSFVQGRAKVMHQD